MKARVDAVFQDGFLEPVQRPDLTEGERVRTTVETVGQGKPDDVLRLATQVYEGLSSEDIDEIEDTARHRAFFSDAHP